MPLKNRDFVNQRSWRVKENEYIIFSHSVAHEVSAPSYRIGHNFRGI